MAIAQQDNARVTMFETPYLYDMLDGKVYPLLADGAYAWDAGMTKITFKIKAVAKVFGVSRHLANAMIFGQLMPSEEQLNKIAQVLEVCPEWLSGRSERRKSTESV